MHAICIVQVAEQRPGINTSTAARSVWKLRDCVRRHVAYGSYVRSLWHWRADVFLACQLGDSLEIRRTSSRAQWWNFEFWSPRWGYLPWCRSTSCMHYYHRHQRITP